MMRRQKTWNRPLLVLIGLLLLMVGCSSQTKDLNPQEIAQRARSDHKFVQAQRDHRPTSVTLYGAMAKAVQANQALRIQAYETSLALQQKALTRQAMLPQLLLDAGYNSRDNDPSSYNEGASAASISREKSTFQGDITLAWNALDFGLSYLETKQQANTLFIKRQQRRKAVQNLLEEVREAYWNAVLADRLLPHVTSTIQALNQQLLLLQQAERQGEAPPVQLLKKQRALLDHLEQLNASHNELARAKLALANLMHLAPGTPYQTRIHNGEFLDGSVVRLPAEVLEAFALANRPELREDDYRQRINNLEVRKAMVKMLPGIQLTAGGHHDSNRYLINNSWLDAGLNLSWNMLTWGHDGHPITIAQMERELADAQHLTRAVTILAQLHMSLDGFLAATADYDVTQQIHQVMQRMANHLTVQRKSYKLSSYEELISRAQTVTSAHRLGRTFTQSQASMGRIYRSLGVDLLPKNWEQAITHENRLAAFIDQGHRAGRYNLHRLASQQRMVAARPPAQIKVPIRRSPIPKAARTTAGQAVVIDPNAFLHGPSTSSVFDGTAIP
ncbi:TolC family protein [Magnetococcus sp. PR-3]|uniref:TolC family protein n=1 Tax=Magnetococcus sp. PR-3 TaxID=3120355 RepID=UPI002FCE312A